MLQNVQTRWMSLIEPLWRFLSEYQTLLYKMTADLNENNKAKDVYIYDFIATIKVCQTSLYWMYEDKETTYNCDKFRSFTNLLDCSHKQIHIKWITDLNDNSALLSFVCHGEQIHAEHKGLPVDREVWTNLLAKVKVECIDKWNALQFKNFMLRLCL